MEYQYILYHDPQVSEKISEYEYETLEKEWSFSFHKPGLFNKHEFKYYIFDWGESKFMVKPEETLYVKTEWNPVTTYYSFEELSREMRSDDFIEYLKDHGLNVCPMK